MHAQRIAGIAERALAKGLAPSVIRVAEHAEDLDRLLAGLFEGRLVRRETIDEVGPARPLQLQMGPIRYSAGIMHARVGWPRCPPRTLLGHLGSTGAFAFWIPEERATIVGSLPRFGSGPRAMRLDMKLAAGLQDSHPPQRAKADARRGPPKVRPRSADRSMPGRARRP